MFHNEWLNARKKLFQQVCSQVQMLAGPLSSDLKKYSLAYQKEFSSTWKPSDMKAFQDDLKTTALVLGGDFHAHSQAQRLHLRVLRELQRPLILGLECVESRHQKWLDQFLSGRITEKTFLEKVKWDDRWGFPWSHYRPLFDWARSSKVQVFGLNRYEGRRAHKSFLKRDVHAAKVIKALSDRFPQHLLYVIFGDLHLAKEHLPRALTQAFKYDPKPLILLQNSEQLYFRNAQKQDPESVNWWASTRRRYCHLSSPPWVKWQSYLMFLEHNFDRELEDDDSDLDLTDQVGSLVRILAKDLGLKISTDELAVYSPGQLSTEHIMGKSLSPLEKKIAIQCIEEDRSFFIPSPGIIYLSRLSINHAAALAGNYIHACLSRSKRVYWKQPEDFRQAIWVECVGFFFSKLINHSRKAENLNTLKARLEASKVKDLTKESLRLALDQRMIEVLFAHTGRLRTIKTKRRKTWVYLEAARIMGEMMGEKLYLAVKANRITRRELVRMLKVDLEDEAEFSKTYLGLVKKLETEGGFERTKISRAGSW